MLPFEQLAAAYFAALAVVGTAMRLAPGRWAACSLAVGMVVAVVVIGRTAPLGLRVWAAHAYLAVGYWIPSLLATLTSTWFEEWLVNTDRGWQRHVLRVPAWLTHVTEAAYLLCYPLVPIAFLVVWTSGDDRDVDRFWMAVLGAGFVCYGALPWLVSRPPRFVSGDRAPAQGVARVNALVLNRVSHQLNTFPSGHVAVSVAAAISVWTVSPVAAAMIGVIAVGVTVGAVTGRYHYVVDVIAGAVVGVLTALAAS